MEYKISRKEMSRRKRAYLTLCVSLLCGLFLSATIFKFHIPTSDYLLVVFALFGLGAFAFRLLRNLSRAKIILTKELLKREVEGVAEHYKLSQINKVKVKWTTNKTIREMYIWLNGGKSIFISALDHPEKFMNDLLQRLRKNVVVSYVHEPLDFDHPLFYSLLGLPISGVGVLTIKLISDLKYQSLRIVLIVFGLYLISLGSYFLIAKPLAKRYDGKKIIYDYLVGILMIGTASVICFLYM